MKISMSGSCQMAVIGMDMNCPLCKTLVKSGESHQCEIVPPKKLLAKPRKKLKAAAQSEER